MPNYFDSYPFSPLSSRPQPVCYCADITPTVIPLRNHLVMLQHPNEVKRCLRTTKIIELSIPTDRYHLFRGKRFPPKKYPDLYDMLESGVRENVLVYPSNDAVSIASLPTDVSYNVFVLDGTWSQAKVLYNTNPMLRSMRCIKLDNTEPSRYVIRTQPTETCLSTVEAVGLVLSHFEENPSIMEWLTKPLKTICDFQLNNGATEHQSKEYLITNGLYQKPLNKRVQKSLDLNMKLDIKDLLC